MTSESRGPIAAHGVPAMVVVDTAVTGISAAHTTRHWRIVPRVVSWWLWGGGRRGRSCPLVTAIGIAGGRGDGGPGC